MLWMCRWHQWHTKKITQLVKVVVHCLFTIILTLCTRRCSDSKTVHIVVGMVAMFHNEQLRDPTKHMDSRPSFQTPATTCMIHINCCAGVVGGAGGGAIAA